MVSLKLSSCDDAEACVVLRALTERGFMNWISHHLPHRRTQKGPCDWMTKQHFGGERNARNSNQNCPAGVPEEDSWKRLYPRIRTGNCAGLNETVWICCWRNRHVNAHIVGLVVRIRRCTVHCFRCWACLPAAAHWQRWTRHREDVSCLLAGSVFYHRVL